MLSYQCRDSHVKDKTVSWTVLSLTWESPYLVKMVFTLRWGPRDKYPQENATGFHICWSLACHLFAPKPLPGLDISKIYTYLTSKIMHVSDHLTKNLKENLAQIHLPNWLFYWPPIIGQWNMSSPQLPEWANSDMLLAGPLVTKISEIQIKMQNCSFTKSQNLQCDNIPPRTKWPPFHRRYFLMHFRELKGFFILIEISLKFIPNSNTPLV